MGAEMNRIRWWLTRAIEHVGWPAIMAWALLIITIAYAYLMLWPVHQQVERLEQQLAIQPTKAKVVQQYHSQGKTFLMALPKVKDVVENIATVFQHAHQYDLHIDEVIYNEQRKLDDDIVRYTMTFSVTSQYPQIKQFLIDVMETLPYMSLDQIDFERDQVSDSKVSTRIRLLFFLGAT